MSHQAQPANWSDFEIDRSGIGKFISNWYVQQFKRMTNLAGPGASLPMMSGLSVDATSEFYETNVNGINQPERTLRFTAREFSGQSLGIGNPITQHLANWSIACQVTVIVRDVMSDPRFVAKDTGVALQDHTIALGIVSGDPDDFFRARIKINGTTINLVSSATVSYGSFYTFVASCDGTGILLRIVNPNGSLVTNFASAVGNLDINSEEMYLGRTAALETNRFNGAIHQIQFFDGFIPTDDQIFDMHRSPWQLLKPRKRRLAPLLKFAPPLGNWPQFCETFDFTGDLVDDVNWDVLTGAATATPSVANGIVTTPTTETFEKFNCLYQSQSNGSLQATKLQIATVDGNTASFGSVFRQPLANGNGHAYELQLRWSGSQWQWIVQETTGLSYNNNVGTAIAAATPVNGDWIGFSVSGLGNSTIFDFWNFGQTDPDDFSLWGTPTASNTANPVDPADTGLYTGLQLRMDSVAGAHTVDAWCGGDQASPVIAVGRPHYELMYNTIGKMES